MPLGLHYRTVFAKSFDYKFFLQLTVHTDNTGYSQLQVSVALFFTCGSIFHIKKVTKNTGIQWLKYWGVSVAITVLVQRTICQLVKTILPIMSNRVQVKIRQTNFTQTRDRILEKHFQSRFLGINSSLLRLKILSVFLPSFFRSTKCYSWIDSSFLVSRTFL